MRTKLPVLSLLVVILSAACGSAVETSAGPAVHRDVVVTAASASRATAGAGAGAARANGYALPGKVSTAAQPAAPAQAPVPPLPSAQHLELSATVAIQMPHDRFDDGLNTVLGIITTERGYLASSSTEANPGGAPRTGSFTFQVPVDNYQDALNRLRHVGRFMGQQSTSKPHDAEYVDLQSRLRSAQLQLDAFNALLSRATSISDIITIEQQVGQVQQQIEQYQGQLRALDGLTLYATVAVELTEKGAAAVPAPPRDQWGFSSSFVQALHNLAAITNGLIVVLGTLLPFLLLGALAFASRRRWLPMLARS